MKSKLESAIGTFPKYLAIQMFFISYILTIYFKASAPSPKIYQPEMVFYLMPLLMAMVFIHLGYLSVTVRKFTLAQRIQILGVLIFYGTIWYVLF
ncbi:hypothetical protein [Arsukibacterium sp.]|uniref:hypothetical protein n=1 Tax=Arsukibacterium sp. TaxID=1977258 RepID=UPI001BD54FEC|nr:hypothetical protein [Arsukibacterium sp.]